MDVYVLIDPLPPTDEDHVVSVHGRFQGAELARSDYARRNASKQWPERRVYDRLIIVNRDVQDADE